MGDTAAISSASETLAFVSTVIAERWPTARASGVSPLRGDASSRAYSRVTIERGGAATAPESLVVMHLSDAAVAISSEELGVFGKGGPAELPFVQRLLEQLRSQPLG